MGEIRLPPALRQGHIGRAGVRFHLRHRVGSFLFVLFLEKLLATYCSVLELQIVTKNQFMNQKREIG